MKRFFKRFFLLLILAGGGLVGYGFYLGMTPDEMIGQAKEWYGQMSSLGSDSSEREPADTLVVESQPTRNKSTPPAVIPAHKYAPIDRHARQAPRSARRGIASLASYLDEPCSNDRERARAIYVWLTDNVTYDDAGYNSGNYKPTDAESVLKGREAVCDGFANLYQALGEEMGLSIKKVEGYAKGYGYQSEKSFRESNHAWNLIRLDGNWRICDATWGQGTGKNVNGKLRSTIEFIDFWFDVDPYAAIFTHLPEDPADAHVSPPLTLSQYAALPLVEKGYFQVGFPARATYRQARQNPQVEFPMAYDPKMQFRVVDAPATKYLAIGTSYRFEIDADAAVDLALITPSKEFQKFKQAEGRWQLDYTPAEAGNVQISAQRTRKERQYWSVLEYTARSGPDPATM